MRHESECACRKLSQVAGDASAHRHLRHVLTTGTAHYHREHREHRERQCCNKQQKATLLPLCALCSLWPTHHVSTLLLFGVAGTLSKTCICRTARIAPGSPARQTPTAPPPRANDASARRSGLSFFQGMVCSAFGVIPRPLSARTADRFRSFLSCGRKPPRAPPQTPALSNIGRQDSAAWPCQAPSRWLRANPAQGEPAATEPARSADGQSSSPAACAR